MALIRKYGSWVLFIVLTLLYVYFAFSVKRTDHSILIVGFLVLVVLSALLYFQVRFSHWTLLFSFGLLFRLAFLFSTPHLSNDFYRFTWDGELAKDGYEVFEFLPKNYKDHIAPEDSTKYGELYRAHSSEFPSGMNSKKYYSIYPTINQLVFVSAAAINIPNERNLIIMRAWILIAEIISFFVLRALLARKNKQSLLGIYWLHPLIIIELTGNLHMEGMAITFMLLAIYFALKNKWVSYAFTASLAIMTKLTPLFLLGAMFRQFDFKRWFLSSALAVIVTFVLFFLILDLNGLVNFKSSFGLYFAWFSFNSGIFYALRDLTFLISGADISATISLVFPFITMLLFGYIIFLKKFDSVTTLLLLFTTYFFFSPIVHPWYITVLIPLGILSKKIFPLVWSILIFGTYIAYGSEFSQPMFWIYLEYFTIIYLLIKEFGLKGNWVKQLGETIYSPDTN